MKRWNLSIVCAALAAALASDAGAQMYGKQAGGGGGISSVTADGVTISGNGSLATPLSGVAASATNPGTLSAAGFSNLSSVAGLDAWEIAQYKTCEIKLSGQLTGATRLIPGQNPAGVAPGAVTNDALIPGGGLTVASSGTRLFGTSVVQNPRSGKYCLAMRAKLAGPTAAQANQVGLYDATGASSDVVVETQGTDDATHYLLRFDDGAGKTNCTGAVVAADGLTHDHVIANDGTTTWHFVDGVINCSLSNTSTHAPPDPTSLYLSVFNSTSGNAKVSRFFFRYVLPL